MRLSTLSTSLLYAALAAAQDSAAQAAEISAFESALSTIISGAEVTLSQAKAAASTNTALLPNISTLESAIASAQSVALIASTATGNDLSALFLSITAGATVDNNVASVTRMTGSATSKASSSTTTRASSTSSKAAGDIIVVPASGAVGAALLGLAAYL